MGSFTNDIPRVILVHSNDPGTRVISTLGETFSYHNGQAYLYLVVSASISITAQQFCRSQYRQPINHTPVVEIYHILGALYLPVALTVSVVAPKCLPLFFSSTSLEDSLLPNFRSYLSQTRLKCQASLTKGAALRMRWGSNTPTSGKWLFALFMSIGN